MATTKYSIVAVKIDDLPTLSQFIYTSNLQQATNRFLFFDWPNKSAQLSLYQKGMKGSFEDSNNEMFKVIESASGETVASLIITRKKPDIDERPPKVVPTANMPAGVTHEFRTFVQRALEDAQKVMVGTDHLGKLPYRKLHEPSLIDESVLSSIFVSSAHRKGGIGSQLVRRCLDKAEAARLPLFLCSVPSARELYLKLGFRDTTHGEVDLSKWGPEYGSFGMYRLFGMLASD